jgi:hypothetical protein
MSENKPLSQAEIDAMLSQLPPKAATPSKNQTRTASVAAPLSKPSEQVSRGPVVAPASVPAPKLPEVSVAPAMQVSSSVVSQGPVSSLQTGVNEMSQRLSQLETTVVRLERLEKSVASAGSNNQITAQQFQDLMKRVQDLGQEIKNISVKLQGTLGYDIYHSYKCEKCSSQGLVSTAFKCTKCGQISWRGWMPKK